MDKQEKAEQMVHNRDYLTRLLSPGDQVWVRYNGSSKTGMTRYYDVYVVSKEYHEIRRITWYVAELCGYRYSLHNDSLVVGGGGFNGPHDIVSSLGHVLFRDVNALLDRIL